MSDAKFKMVIKSLNNWAREGWKDSISKSVKILTERYKKNMRAGREPNGMMQPVKEVTMRTPIRWGGPDKRIRGKVNPSRNKPIQATGKTINGITSKRRGRGWEISSNSKKGDMILTLNHDRYGRDPLRVTGKELDIIRDTVLKDLMGRIIG